MLNMSNDNWKDLSSIVCETCMYYINARCRRNAPTMGGYPAVFKTDWCGEHKMSKLQVEALEKPRQERDRVQVGNIESKGKE